MSFPRKRESRFFSTGSSGQARGWQQNREYGTHRSRQRNYGRITKKAGGCWYCRSWHGWNGRVPSTIESFQIILSIIVSKKLDAWVKVYVNVGDYRQKREETLMHMAQRAAERAISFGHPVELPNLTPGERRVIHLTLGGDERVETESVGEGMNRTLVVKPKV